MVRALHEKNITNKKITLKSGPVLNLGSPWARVNILHVKRSLVLLHSMLTQPKKGWSFWNPFKISSKCDSCQQYLRYAMPFSSQFILECEQFFNTEVYGPMATVAVIQRSAYASHSMLLALDPSQGTSPKPQAWHLSEEAVLRNIPYH